MECRTETRTDFESAAKRQSLSEQDPLRQVPRLTVEEARRQLYGLASGLVRLRKPAGSLLGRARLVGPHRRGGLPLVPEIDTSATLDRLERLARENTELHEELEALGMVLGALQRLGQPTAIERLIPFDELVRTVAGDQQRGDESPLAVPGAGRCHSRGGRLDLWGGAAPSIKEPVMMMRVLVLVAGATGAVAKQPTLAPRLAAGEVGAVLMTELRGACNAKAKRELGWRPAQPGWRRGFAT